MLVDGFVRAVWRIERGRRTATLVIEPLAPIRKQDRLAIADEGTRLVADGCSRRNGPLDGITLPR